MNRSKRKWTIADRDKYINGKNANDLSTGDLVLMVLHYGHRFSIGIKIQVKDINRILPILSRLMRSYSQKQRFRLAVVTQP